MLWKIRISLVFLSIIAFNVESARILAYFFVPSLSHQYVFQPIWRELSLRGHQVTVITPNPLKDEKLTNLTEIDTSFVYNLFKNNDVSHWRREFYSPATIINNFYQLMSEMNRMELEHEDTKKILGKPAGTYDLIIVEALNLMAYGLSHKFKAPVVGVMSVSASFYAHNAFGNPTHPVLYPDVLTEAYGSLNLWQKFDSVYVCLSTWYMCKFEIIPASDKKARESFGDDMPFIEDIFKDSLLFVNVNPIFSDKRPLVPNMMEFSFVHSGRDAALPQDLEQILNKSTDGVVYFSLGTNVRFDHVEGNVKETFLRALGALNYTVFCKWESDDYQGGPKNVIFRKWFPQQAVLAHPNIKVFVTQGGLQSAEEAISNGVPLVVIPFLGDQPMNAKILTNHGMAETIPPKTLTEELLRDTINKVATEEKYRNRAKELRNIFLDQPQSGIDKIIWWCEYVIRHKGAKHLRSPGADIPLYEYFMLDVLAVILICCFVVFIALRSILRMAFALFLKSGKPKKD